MLIMDCDNFDSDCIEEKGYNIVYKNGITDFRENFILMLKNAIPAYFSTILDEISSSISIALVGHLSSQSELAAIGISETFVLIFFIYPVISNMGAIDTFVSTSYGNKQYYLCGVYLNRALIILTFLSIPFTIVLFFMKEILLYLGQDPQIAEMSQIYFYYRIPTLFVMMYGEILRRFMQAMGYFNLLSILVVVQLVSHIIFLPIFIYGLKMNYLGAAVALGFSNLVGLIVPILYLKFIDPNRLPEGCMHWFNKDSFKGWWNFIKISIPSTFMSLIEGGTFEAMAILAGIFSINELSANTILNDIVMMIYMSCVGISIASTALIGKDLGEGKYKNAQVLCKCTLVVGIIAGGIQIMIMIFLHYFVFRFYTSNDQVIEILNALLIVIIFQAFFDNIQGSLKGVFRALGKQKLASLVLMFSYWIVGGLSAYIFAFVLGLKLKGLWIGYTFATGICTIFYLSIILTIDWKKECKITLKRIEEELENV